jgi:hypothetical protein
MARTSAALVPQLRDRRKSCEACRRRDLPASDWYLDRRRRDYMSPYCALCTDAADLLRLRRKLAAAEVMPTPKPKRRPRKPQPPGFAKHSKSRHQAMLERLARGEKHCPDCQETKPNEAFYENPHHPDGLSTYCRRCTRIRRNDYVQRIAAVRQELAPVRCPPTVESDTFACCTGNVTDGHQAGCPNEPKQRCTKCRRELPAGYFVSLRTSEPTGQCVRCQKGYNKPPTLTPVQTAFAVWGETAAEQERRKVDQAVAEQRRARMLTVPPAAWTRQRNRLNGLGLCHAAIRPVTCRGQQSKPQPRSNTASSRTAFQPTRSFAPSVS